MKSRYQPTRRALIFWTLFIGLGAVAGSVGMLADPTGKAMGMDAMLPYFQKLPLAELLYRDFRFPGVALLAVNGIPNLVAAALLLRRKPAGDILGGVLGVTLMLWICIQFYMFPLNFMSTIYFVFGFLQAVTGYMAWVFRAQEAFRAAPAQDIPAGADPRRLVVYFSRMGYTRNAALAEARRTGAQIFEIQATEPVDGTLGFWWCGRFGMHRWAMPIAALPANLDCYDHVTICSPIWVFHLAAPVRAFCQAARGQIREADYILLHYQKARYGNAAREMDALLGLRHSPYRSICCRRGQCKKEESFQ